MKTTNVQESVVRPLFGVSPGPGACRAYGPTNTRPWIGIWTVLAATLSLALFSASPANATTDTIYAGEQCVRGTISAGQPTTSFYGSIGNPSSNGVNLFVDCPLAHNVFSSGIAYGVVAVINQIGGNAFTDRVACTLFAVNIPADGQVTESWDTEYSGSTSSNTQYLVFGRLNANDHYYYNCLIPPKYNGKTSYINAYRINEY